MKRDQWTRNNTEDRACIGKKVYPSWDWAAYDARELTRKNRDEPHREVYRCRYCQGIHVGSGMSRRELREREAA